MGNQKIWMDKVKVMYVDSRTYLATQIVNDADILFDTFVYICDRHEASRSLVYSAHCLCLVPRLDSQNQHPLPKRMQPFYRKSEIWDSASGRPQKECHRWRLNPATGSQDFGPNGMSNWLCLDPFQAARRLVHLTKDHKLQLVFTDPYEQRRQKKPKRQKTQVQEHLLLLARLAAKVADGAACVARRVQGQYLQGMVSCGWREELQGAQFRERETQKAKQKSGMSSWIIVSLSRGLGRTWQHLDVGKHMFKTLKRTRTEFSWSASPLAPSRTNPPQSNQYWTCSHDPSATRSQDMSLV